MISIIKSLLLIRKKTIFIDFSITQSDTERMWENMRERWINERGENKRRKERYCHTFHHECPVCVWKGNEPVWRKGRKEGKYHFFATHDNPHFDEWGCLLSYRAHHISFSVPCEGCSVSCSSTKNKNIFLEKIKIKNKFEKQKKCQETKNTLATTQQRSENSTLIVENRVQMVPFVHFTVLL